MEVICNPQSMDGCVLVLGMFDGVHRGHQELLMQGLDRARTYGVPLVVSTFEPHPMELLCPDRAPKRLTTLSERIELMESYGVDRLCVNTFTREVADTPPEAFMEQMIRTYAPRCVICGFNYSFGARGSGKPSDLIACGQAHGFETLVIPSVEIAGEPVSSTRIRAQLREGHIRMASRLLGHAYTLSGRVEDGKHIGRTLGFPTANVAYDPCKVLPDFGVYIGYLRVKQGRAMESVINIGRHPTLPEGPVTLEVHVLQGHPELYGKDVEVILMDFVREEIRFASRDALMAQIQQDRETAASWFAAHSV